MVHRYLAMSVGVLILVSAAVSWRVRARLPHSPWWPRRPWPGSSCRGFSASTPSRSSSIRRGHAALAGRPGVAALLVLQHESFRDRPLRATLPRGAVAGCCWCCSCRSRWAAGSVPTMRCWPAPGFRPATAVWPGMDVASGFTLLRELGRAGHGGYLPFDALWRSTWRTGCSRCWPHCHRLLVWACSAAIRWRCAATRGCCCCGRAGRR